MRRALVLSALVAVLPGALGAQGGLSVQGFGYPTGQLSGSSLALGGATAELDASSAINPAAVGLPSRFAIYMQFEPEFRRTAVNGASDRSTTIRFPGFLVSGGVGRFAASISATTFLDRTWRNVYSDSQLVGGELVPSTLVASSNGAITDTRAAASYWINPKVRVGLGLHALVGENRTEFGRSFPASTGLGSVTQFSTLSYSGRALTAGVVYFPVRSLSVGASLRQGGHLEARQDDASLAKGSAPDRMGISVAYTGIPNTTIAARFEHTAWSEMKDLGTAQVSAFDANDVGLGMEVVGPRVAGAPSFARLGVRSRTLPFGVNGDQVSEKAMSGGIAIPFARGRAQADLTLQRATRSAAGASEKAWFLSIGLGIRP